MKFNLNISSINKGTEVGSDNTGNNKNIKFQKPGIVINYKQMKIILIIGLMLIGLQNIFAQQERKYIRQGNRQYNAAFADSSKIDSVKFQQSETNYRKALEKEPNSWDATYNLGNSLYRQKKYEEAMRQYQAASSMSHDNKEQLAQAFHNLGNTLLQGNQLEPAVEAYKNALRNNPNDYQTKYNLAWALDKMKQQQNQQQQDQNKDQQDKDKQDQQDQKDQQQKDQQDQQNKDQQQKQDQQKQQQEQQQNEQQEKNKISKEDAQRILEALQNQEKGVQEKIQKEKAKSKKVTLEKDW